MNENEFRKSYAQIEDAIKASDELKRRTKKSLGISEGCKKEKTDSSMRESRSTSQEHALSRKSGGRVITLSPAWKAAFAACLAIIAGVGILFSTGLFSKTDAAIAGNSFALVAYADGSSAGSNAAVGIGFEKFYPMRTSAGYLYDAENDTTDDNTVIISRYYSFDMTVSGNNVESVAYSIEGEGVSYGSWKRGSGNEGAVSEETTTSFKIPYDDKTPVMREIGLNYVLDDTEKAEFDKVYTAKDANGIETLIATCDAKRLANTTITATATFTDGTSQAKSYTFEPVDGFETMYRDYLSRLSGTEDPEAWSSLAGEPSLFNLVEKEC